MQSAYFNNYEANREGFSKLYRKLADDAWEDTIDLIKYMAKRGFNMNYDITPRKKVQLEFIFVYFYSKIEISCVQGLICDLKLPLWLLEMTKNKKIG